MIKKTLSLPDSHEELTVLLETLAAEAAEPSVPEKARTAAQRRDAQRAMLERFDLDKLLEMQEKMSRAVDRMTANHINVEEPGSLSPSKAEDLMAELLDQTDIKDLLEVRRDMIRTAVFAHLTEEARRVGHPDPEYVTGSISVPAMDKKFVRDGGTRTAPTIDEEMLRAALGDHWEAAYRIEVIPEQIIPEHVEYTLDPEKIMALAERDPSILEALRQSLIPGERRTPRFSVRNL